MSTRRKREKTASGNKKAVIKSVIDLPESLNPTLPHIEAEGNREISVDGCRGILEYGQDRIKLNAGSLIIAFYGDNLEIKVYSDIQTVIAGSIASIEFEN